MSDEELRCRDRSDEILRRIDELLDQIIPLEVEREKLNVELDEIQLDCNHSEVERRDCGGYDLGVCSICRDCDAVLDTRSVVK